MKNEHIKPNEEVPVKLRLKVYKEALNVNWKKNETGLCHLLPMLLWGFNDELDAYNKFKHYFYNTKNMFPELKPELSKIHRATNENLVRRNSIKRMIAKLENK